MNDGQKGVGAAHSYRPQGPGLTGEALSELCHINATYLRQIEAGRKSPSMEVLLTLCRALRVSPNFLLAEDLPAGAEDDVELLIQLYHRATPAQIRVIAAMVRSALDLLETENEQALAP